MGARRSDTHASVRRHCHAFKIGSSCQATPLDPSPHLCKCRHMALLLTGSRTPAHPYHNLHQLPRLQST